MPCPRCGKQINERADRCKYCGWQPGQPAVVDAPTDQAVAPVTRVTSGPAPAPAPTVVMSPVVVKSGMSCWVVGIIITLTVLALPVCAFLAFGGLAAMARLSAGG
jgi:hypothetical protein